ncbi:hypothetical protein CI102_14980 [Trichoderma harzianum]|nr:hypothetical protein CI102_14980 [Trichoderma harzianum]
MSESPEIPDEIIECFRPKVFRGKYGTLSKFFLQLKTFERLFPTVLVEPADRIIHVSTYLKGRAASFFALTLLDYLDNPAAEQKKET